MDKGADIGFIGTGVITSALVTGFCSGGDLGHRIHLSPRNAERAAALAERFESVSVARSNQEVLDRSEWVVLAVVPRIGEEVVRPLTFRADHRVVNLMADRKLPEIARWIGKTRTLVHLVPLPFAARRVGPIALYPPDGDASALFSALGRVVAVDDPRRIEVLAAVTALMASFHTLLWEVVKWGEGEGLSRKEALDYSAAFFEALSAQAREVEGGDIGRLAGEMTPGGLNEMALCAIRDRGGIESFVRALGPVLARLRK